MSDALDVLTVKFARGKFVITIMEPNDDKGGEFFVEVVAYVLSLLGDLYGATAVDAALLHSLDVDGLIVSPAGDERSGHERKLE